MKIENLLLKIKRRLQRWLEISELQEDMSVFKCDFDPKRLDEIIDDEVKRIEEEGKEIEARLKDHYYRLEAKVDNYLQRIQKLEGRKSKDGVERYITTSNPYRKDL